MLEPAVLFDTWLAAIVVIGPCAEVLLTSWLFILQVFSCQSGTEQCYKAEDSVTLPRSSRSAHSEGAVCKL